MGKAVQMFCLGDFDPTRVPRGTECLEPLLDNAPTHLPSRPQRCFTGKTANGVITGEWIKSLWCQSNHRKCVCVTHLALRALQYIDHKKKPYSHEYKPARRNVITHFCSWTAHRRGNKTCDLWQVFAPAQPICQCQNTLLKGFVAGLRLHIATIIQISGLTGVLNLFCGLRAGKWFPGKPSTESKSTLCPSGCSSVCLNWILPS